MRILMGASKKGKWVPGRFTRQVIGWVLALGVIAGLLNPALAAEIGTSPDPARISAKDMTAQSGKCKITVLGAYFWRDWMPLVKSPGPDGGSPLQARVKLSLENSAGDANKFTFRAAIVDNRGQSYYLPFRVFPDFQVIPDDFFKSYRNYDGETKKKITVKYNVIWDGGLNPGEIKEIELVSAEGPYLPAGSSIHVRIEWTDKKGDTAVVRTPDQPIERTD